MLSPSGEGDGTVFKLGEVVMILDLHPQGLSVWAIAGQLGIDRKTVRKNLARGLEAPVYGRGLAGFDRPTSLAGTQGARLPGRLHRRHRCTPRAAGRRQPPSSKCASRRRRSTRSGSHFAQFQVVFADESGVTRILPRQPLRQPQISRVAPL